MKYRIATSFLILAALLAPSAALAQEAPSAIPAMVAQLKLTPAQRKKLEPMYAENARKVKAIREDASLSAEEKRSRLNEINQTTMKTLNETLTSAQRTKLQELRRQQKG